ncbi:MAG TPA: HDIG domain-containing protein [Clostridiales bacterium]|nr:HDIG domain-containing protein [Clostridiales bacterium]
MKGLRIFRLLKTYIVSTTFQKILIGILTLIISFIIVENGAVPKRYKLYAGMVSPYDIPAPRDIENVLLTEQKAFEAANNVPAAIIRKVNIPIEVLNCVDDFFMDLESARKKANGIIQEKGLTKKSKNYEEEWEKVQRQSVEELKEAVKELNLVVPLSDDQLSYLVGKISDDELVVFKKTIRELISEVMAQEVTNENLAFRINASQNSIQSKELNQEIKNLGGHLIKAFIKPNSEIDIELTETKRKEAYNNFRENNKIIVKKNSRIVSVEEVITEDKMQMLKELNLIETGKIDYVFAIGIMVILLLLALLLLVYMNFNCKHVLSNRNYIIVLCIVIVMILFLARVLYVYSPLLIPFSIAAMLIAILIDFKLAIIANFILTLAISIMTKGDIAFLYMSLVSGTLATFLVSRVNQRSSLTAAGLITSCINAIIIACFGILSKNQLKTIALDSAIVFANGFVSVIITIGMLPLWETAFNLVTPLKLLELANPNQALLKKLLIEAPGTYHHSLMVGNLAEVAIEALGGNPLLARVGAYYHDVGKLKRPDFFGENQISGNPHDKMNPSLSTLVIISHTEDGVKIAEKYKLPQAIKEIIVQHHGTTMVAYFFHKAKKEDKTGTVKEEAFRYPGPKPTSKEAAVVMLADSVEAAVRSMTEKTEGKIEGLVRKIIKDKLDDGQLDLCDLTLKDLDTIANSFMRVFSGFFHARQKYPEIIKAGKEFLEEKVFVLPDTIVVNNKINDKTNIDHEINMDDEISGRN